MLAYDPTFDRTAQNETVGDLKFKEHFDQYDQEFAPEVIDVEVLLANSQVNEFTTAKGHDFKREDMILVVKLKDRYWHRLKIKGATVKEDGTRGKYSTQMHDFFCLALRQNPQALSDPSDYTFDDGNKVTYYPHLYGLKFKICIAKVSEFKGYDVNSFSFFDVRGFSAPELETNATQPQALGLCLEDLKNQYNAFKGAMLQEQNTYNQLDQGQASAPSASESAARENIPF